MVRALTRTRDHLPAHRAPKERHLLDRDMVFATIVLQDRLLQIRALRNAYSVRSVSFQLQDPLFAQPVEVEQYHLLVAEFVPHVLPAIILPPAFHYVHLVCLVITPALGHLFAQYAQRVRRLLV